MEDRTTQDQRVVRAVLAGDGEAFAELVGRYQRMVAGVAWRYGVRRDEVEDLVSEVFLKVYRKLHQYQPSHPFPTWLYRLAANHVLDHGRRQRRERGRTEMPRHVEDPAPGPGERIEAEERARLVREAIAALPSHYRETVFLVYVSGLGVEQTARTLGLPQGTIKSRLKRGRDALRRSLVQRYPGQFGD